MVLPEPVRPTIASDSPAGTLKVTSSRTVRSAVREARGRSTFERPADVPRGAAERSVDDLGRRRRRFLAGARSPRGRAGRSQSAKPSAIIGHVMPREREPEGEEIALA